MNIKPPNINGPNKEVQLQQIKEYLFMLANELNFKFSIIDKELEERRK